MKYAELALHYSVIRLLGKTFGNKLNKGNTKYYIGLRKSWQVSPIRVVVGGVRARSDNNAWRVFLAGGLRDAVKLAFKNGSWDVTVNTYNDKLRAISHFSEFGTFVVPRNTKLVKPVALKAQRSRGKIKKNESELAYLIPIIKAEVDRQLVIVGDLFNEINAVNMRDEIWLKFSFADGVRRSRAGRRKDKPFMSFALSAFKIFTKHDTKTFYEYKAFSSDDEIGTAHNCLLGQYVSLLVAHEISHVVQFELHFMFFNKLISEWRGYCWSDIRKAHGSGWRKIYKSIRKAAVE